MTDPTPIIRPEFDWDGAAEVMAKSLDGYNALVVIGVDPVTTGRVAVAIGRSQAQRRRVAVGDLFAESPPIQALVDTDDPHGIVDSFLYGVSLSRIAYPVANAGQLFVMPSGSEAPVYEEILPSPRWNRLAAGFREVGALLILAAPASAARIEELVSATDGAILVGGGVPANLPVVRVISAVRETPAKGFQMPTLAEGGMKQRRARRRLRITVGIALTAVIGLLTAWLASRPLAAARARHAPVAPAGTAAGANPDTALVASGVEMAGASLAPAPPVANPQDSAAAAAYAVELTSFNTQAGAILKLQQDGGRLPAATFTPVLDAQGARWFKVVSGAVATRERADSLLARLRAQQVLESTLGTVVRLPFAFRVDSGVPASAVNGMVAMYAGRGQPVYALRQDDGTAWLLMGAFESVDQSRLYAESLRASGLKPTPVLVYRKGRMF